MNRRLSDILDESLAVEYEDAREAGALGFMARALVQATLPHLDPKTHYFERTNGLVTLSIVNRPQVGVPYGTLPRILMAWLCTEAVRTQNPELLLGKSQADFMRKLQLATGGRDVARLKDQAHRLFSSMISLTGKRGDETGLENITIAKRAMLFWNPRNPDEESKWESSLTLTADFFEEVTSSPIPIDMRVLHALKQSAMAMDIYTWLTYRVFLLRVKNRGQVVIPWERLKAQFGSGYGSRPGPYATPEGQAERDRKAISHFRFSFERRLREVLVFYPEAKNAIDATGSGLTVRACELHIEHRPSKRSKDPLLIS